MQVAVWRAARAGTLPVGTVANGHCDLRTLGHAVNVPSRLPAKQ
jgi:hypothetical protein